MGGITVLSKKDLLKRGVVIKEKKCFEEELVDLLFPLIKHNSVEVLRPIMKQFFKIIDDHFIGVERVNETLQRLSWDEAQNKYKLIDVDDLKKELKK